VLLVLNQDDARVTAPTSCCESALTSPATRTYVLQQLCQQVNDEDIVLLAQVLTPDTQRRINEYRTKYELKRPAGLAGMDQTPTSRTSPSPPSSVHTPFSTEFNPLPPQETIIPTTQIDVGSNQPTPPIDDHPTKPEIDQPELPVRPRHRRETIPPAELDDLPPIQRSFH